MHAGKNYTVKEVLLWTRRESILFLVIAALPVILHAAGIELPPLPWQPIAVLGTAVAFVTGFKSNAAYGRTWEARKIWGGIVNASRSFCVLVRDFVQTDDGGATHTRIVHRHLAWLTALRHQLRQRRTWESATARANVEYQRRTFRIPECDADPRDELEPWLNDEDLEYVLPKKNQAAALLGMQSKELARCAANGQLTEYRHVELTRIIGNLYDEQGRSERIKNFPYPRQFSTMNHIFVWLFIVLLPFGVHEELLSRAPDWAWLTIPLTAIVAWVFHTMDKIGGVSENPFQGGPNDIPITAMSRGIEIDLRDLLDDPDLPQPLTPQRNILM